MRVRVAYPSGYDCVRVLRMAGTTMNWDRLRWEAERQMKQSRQQIENSRTGVPSKRSSDWRVGSGPSTYKEKR